MVNILIVVEGAGTEDWPAEQRDDGNCQEKVRKDYLDYFTAFTVLFFLRMEIIEEQKGLEREVATLAERLVNISFI